MCNYLVVSFTTAALLLSACSSGGGESAGSGGDQVPPLAGSVADGLAADIDIQTSTTTISANWSGFSDNEGPIAYYEWCIGTTVGGSQLQGWVSTGSSISATNSSLSLQTGVRYYVSVRAYDLASNVSAVATSDGVELGATGGGSGPTQSASLSQWGITWTFDREYTVGQFCNGDWWVVGPVTLVQITPGCEVLNGRTINGTMVNPSTDGSNGYDSQISRYQDTLNIARNLSPSNPVTLPVSTSVISTIAQMTRLSGSEAQLRTAAVLTVLAAVPSNDAFRPPYSGNDKTIRFRESDMNYGVLAQLAPAAGAPSMAETAALFERVWLDHAPNWTADFFHPVDNMRNYSRDFAADTGNGALMLNCSFSNAQKRDLLVRMVQLGIDNYGNLSNGCSWEGDGGEGSGRKFPILFAGRVLSDQAMLSIGQQYQTAYRPSGNSTKYFGEDSQTFYVQESSPGVINWGFGNYTPSHLGWAEWGLRHSYQPQSDNSDWHAVPYRLCCTANAWIGYCLAARVMGLQQAWNHQAFFDYMDRHTSIEDPNTWTYRWIPWQGDMWQAYRAQF